jgi:pyruvate-formate lyase-activating enzyme
MCRQARAVSDWSCDASRRQLRLWTEAGAIEPTMSSETSPPVPDEACDGPRWSCRYLEGGLSFTSGRVNACSITHHGRGEAVLAEYAGQTLPLVQLSDCRREIVEENQGAGHSACVGCPMLSYRSWPRREYAFDWIGITHFLGCNLSCQFCWLEWADYSPRRIKTPVHPYDIGPVIAQLIDERLLDPAGEVDWGGGGEPTLMPEFGPGFVAFHDYGVTQWLHTNAVRLPTVISERREWGPRVQVVCSIDAGTAESYRRIKQRDAFESVWSSLRRFIEVGAGVTLKYIMLRENCSDSEMDEFVGRARQLGPVAIVTDIDYRQPTPTEAIMNGLLRLQTAAHAAGLPVRYGSTGEYSAVNHETSQRLAAHAAELFRPTHPAQRQRAWQAAFADLS